MSGIKSKKGIYFTADAIFASFLLVATLFILTTSPLSDPNTEQTSFLSHDLLSSLSELKIKEVNNTFIYEEIANGNITDINKTILEQIGEYWARNQSAKAEILAQSIISDMLPKEIGFQLVIGDTNLSLQNLTNRKNIVTSSRMISGIEENKPLLGSSASAYLTKIIDKRTSSYAYFGGFVGQGNITILLEDIPSDVSPSDITSIILEADLGGNFSFIINGDNCKNVWNTSINMSPDVWDLTECNTSIVPGTNNISLSYNEDINDAHISGGYVKIDYKTDELQQNISISENTHFFPEIRGIVNLYDAFYVPGNITDMQLYLHYIADHSVNALNSTFYLTIGNDTIFVDIDSVTEQSVTINDATLSTLINYSALTGKTVPIRMGFENLTYSAEFVGNSEVMLVTDVSGSMNWMMIGPDWVNGVNRNCDNTNINDSDTERLSVAKCLDKEFAQSVLNITGNSIGLVSYSDSTDDSDTVSPTTNYATIASTIGNASPETGYSPGGGTCICCGINSARDELISGASKATLISSGSSWLYETNGFNGAPANDTEEDAWYEMDFDDTSWSSGNAVLGHDAGGGGVTTDLGESISTGETKYVDLWEDGNDVAGAPNDFTSGPINSTANTFGEGAGHDGWDWQGSVYGYDNNVDFNGVVGGQLDMDFRTGGSNYNYCSSRDCSGAYGISVNITDEMYTMISQNGTAFLTFDYEWLGNTGSNPFESADQIWIKAKWIKPGGTEYWLGDDLDLTHYNGDSDPEIWTVDNPDLDFSGTALEDLTDYIDGAGIYYLHIGGKLRASASNEWGDVYFDNIQLAITNQTDKYYFRKSFNIADINTVRRGFINLLNDDLTNIYVNGNLIHSGTTKDSGTIWDIRGITVTGGNFKQGMNVVAVELLNNAGDAKFDMELIGIDKAKAGAMLVMTDGQANNQCGEQSTGSSSGDAIQAACDAREDWGIQVFAVGFSSSADEPTLSGIAACGEGIYTKSDNVSALSDFYNQVVLSIISATIRSQTIIISGGDLSASNLYGDSYIHYEYTPILEEPEPSKISLELQSEQFNSCTPTVEIPEGISIVEAKVTSYSAEHWTNLVVVNSQTVFNLSEYNNEYITLGDPYIVNIPPSLLVNGNNQIIIGTGDSPGNSTGCSLNNTLIYTALVNSSTTRSSVLEKVEGCEWTIETLSGNLININVPSSYSGPNKCSYNSTDITYNSLDAYDVSVYDLMNQLDYNNDGTIFIDIDKLDLEIIITTIGKIPYMWGPSIIRAEVWQ